MFSVMKQVFLDMGHLFSYPLGQGRITFFPNEPNYEIILWARVSTYEFFVWAFGAEGVGKKTDN